LTQVNLGNDNIGTAARMPQASALAV